MFTLHDDTVFAWFMTVMLFVNGSDGGHVVNFMGKN